MKFEDLVKLKDAANKRLDLDGSPFRIGLTTRNSQRSIDINIGTPEQLEAGREYQTLMSNLSLKDATMFMLGWQANNAVYVASTAPVNKT